MFVVQVTWQIFGFVICFLLVIPKSILHTSVHGSNNNSGNLWICHLLLARNTQVDFTRQFTGRITTAGLQCPIIADSTSRPNRRPEFVLTRWVPIFCYLSQPSVLRIAVQAHQIPFQQTRKLWAFDSDGEVLRHSALPHLLGRPWNYKGKKKKGLIDFQYLEQGLHVRNYLKTKTPVHHFRCANIQTQSVEFSIQI